METYIGIEKMLKYATGLNEMIFKKYYNVVRSTLCTIVAVTMMNKADSIVARLNVAVTQPEINGGSSSFTSKLESEDIDTTDNSVGKKITKLKDDGI
ncbi:hypothetical protein RND71_015837 [Anisodus tanguticus]|uniref:Uncharacterized protein n=1 Tax=Anisodus tanguticus TaxID=243964 RepID=A0AAE1VKQ1_9SOLA|nr:hypothetical protein RND71_015837 [Anisodus tanguticus]